MSVRVVFDEKKAAEHAKAEFARLQALHQKAVKGAAPATEADLKALVAEYETFPTSYAVRWEDGGVKSADAQALADEITTALNAANTKLGAKHKTLERLFNAGPSAAAGGAAAAGAGNGVRVVYDPEKAGAHAKSEFARLQALSDKVKQGVSSSADLKALIAEYNSFPVSYAVNFEVGGIKSTDAQNLADDVQNALNAAIDTSGLLQSGELTAHLPRLFNAPRQFVAPAPKAGVRVVFDPAKAAAHAKAEFDRLVALQGKVKAALAANDVAKQLPALVAEYNSFPVSYSVNFEAAGLKSSDAQRIADEVQDALNKAALEQAAAGAAGAAGAGATNTKQVPRLFNAPHKAPLAGARIIGGPAGVYSPEKALLGVQQRWNDLERLLAAAADKLKGPSTAAEVKALVDEYLAFPVTYQVNWALAGVKPEDAQKRADDLRDKLHALADKHKAELAGTAAADALPRLFNAGPAPSAAAAAAAAAASSSSSSSSSSAGAGAGAGAGAAAAGEHKHAGTAGAGAGLTQHDVSTLNFLFKQVDVDKSGFIDFREARQLLRLWHKPTDAEIKELLAQFGATASGKVSKQQFLLANSRAHNIETNEYFQIELSDQAKKTLEARFDALDTDKSGEIDAKELETLARNLYTPSDEMVEAFFGAVDADKDFQISFQEFLNKAAAAQKLFADTSAAAAAAAPEAEEKKN